MKLPSPKKTLPIAAVVAAGSLSAVAAAGFTREPPEPPAPAPGVQVAKDSISLAPGIPQWKSLRLGKASRAEASWGAPLPARVRIDERAAADVGAPLGGRIGKVHVELGQAVKAGDPLFTVSSPDLAELRETRSRAAVDLAAARTNWDRVHALVQARAIPAKEELTAKQQLAQAELADKAASARLASLKVQSSGENEFVVRAPRDGIVVEKHVVASQEVTPDAGALVRIADLASVQVVAELFPGDASGLHAGTKAEITLPSDPGVRLEANVEWVSAVVDPDRHVVPVRIRVPNANSALRPNAYAQVRFESVGAGPVEVAASAICSDGAHQYVYVQQGENGHFVRRSVKAAASRGDRVSILDGLAEGETVVVEGALLLDNQINLDS